MEGTDLGIEVEWSATDAAAEVLIELAETWKRAGSYPGDSAMDADRIFGRLLLGLNTAIESRLSGGDGQLAPVIEMLSENWAMTDLDADV